MLMREPFVHEPGGGAAFVGHLSPECHKAASAARHRKEPGALAWADVLAGLPPA